MSAEDLEEYRRHHDRRTAAEALSQSAGARSHGNDVGGAWGGSATGTQRDGRGVDSTQQDDQDTDETQQDDQE